jgi:hypothetical protein
MRNGQNKRMRGRNRGGKGQNPLTRVYESNGPDVKIRGTASHVADKYMQLARDANSSGDPVAAEAYFQHAEHYFRLIAAANEQFRQNNPYYQQQGGTPQGAADTNEDDFEDGEPESMGGHQSSNGEQPQFGTRDPQPVLPRDAQFFSPRDQQGGRQQHQPRQERHENGRQDNGRHDNGRQDSDGNGGLPSFITGGQPQPAPQNFQNGQSGQEGGQGDRDRFQRRRRRHRGPRPEGQGGRGDDAGPGQD